MMERWESTTWDCKQGMWVSRPEKWDMQVKSDYRLERWGRQVKWENRQGKWGSRQET